MSTKIYNGWKLGNVDVFDVQNRVNDIFRPALLQRINEVPLNDAVLSRDRLDFQDGRFSKLVDYDAKKTDYFKYSPTKTGTYTWRDLYNIASRIQREENKEGYNAPNVEVVYFRHPSTHEIFCFFYGDNDMTAKFEEEFGEPFCYWNNSDQPEDVTDEEWKNRIATWNEVLDLDKATGSQGLKQVVLDSFDLEAHLSYLTSGGKINFISVQERAKELAKLCVDDENIKKAKKAGKDMEDFPYSYFVSSERREAISLLAEEISGNLEEISLEDLIQKLNPKNRK